MASDFVRKVVRDKLKATKAIKTRDINHEEEKKVVLNYDLIWAITEELKTTRFHEKPFLRKKSFTNNFFIFDKNLD